MNASTIYELAFTVGCGSQRLINTSASSAIVFLALTAGVVIGGLLLKKLTEPEPQSV